jgi:NADH:ubiquinone oxidoreductase subunit K
MVHDGQRGRRIARALIGLAIGFGLATLFIVVARPGWFDPMFMAWWAIALPVVAVTSYFIGLGWMVRIYRAHQEAGERTGRYRDRDDTTRGPALRTLEPAVGTHPPAMTTEGQRGRRIARGLIALAIVWGLGALFLWVAQPGYIGPMVVERQGFEIWLPIVGIVSYFIGLGLMVRIYRANPEPGERSWRYRDF